LSHKAKGNSLIDFIDDYTVIDIETTGLSPSKCCIIEVAAVRVRDGDVADTFQSLVNPGYEIRGFITGLTGITNKMLETAPFIDEVLPQYIDFIGTDIIVGHNVNFDIGFICDKCNRWLNIPFLNNFIDTMRISRSLFREHRHHRLSDLIGRFSIAETVEHRALSDAIKTNQCYNYMKEHIKKNKMRTSDENV